MSTQLAIPPADETSDSRRWTLLLLALGVVVPVAYVLLTQHVWEDFLITFRHSKNLAEGNGLVFTPGRRIQGFTSFLNTILPAAFYWISGRDGYETSLNLYRAVCLAVYLLGGVVFLRVLTRSRGIERWTPLVFILLYVTDAKLVAFTMNGQESAFMAAFLAIGFAAAVGGIGRCWKLAAISWTGLLYTRPDVPVHIAVLVITSLLFSGEQRSQTWRGVLKAASIAAILYLPWFITVWVYYGQPLPNTMLAKSTLSAGELLGNPGMAIKSFLRFYPAVSGWVFEPIYAFTGGWPDGPMQVYSLICAAICTGYWLIPTDDRVGRAASFVFTLITLYLCVVNAGYAAAPWYLPSAGVFGLVVLARAPVELFRRIPWLARRPHVYSRSLQGLIVLGSALLLVGTTVQMRIQQREIEYGVRKPIGLLLHDQMKPGEIAYMEPLGYIGYFSDREIWDFPGLVSPEVAKLHHQKLDRITIIPKLMPDYMVLRDWEVQAASRLPEVRQYYEIVKIFDVRPVLQQYGYIPGRAYLELDDHYYVLRKKRSPTTAPATTRAGQ